MNSILCLGDSYTIGEGVALHENFPYQLVQLLRHNNYAFHAPEIVAKTGWTTFELINHLQQIQLQSQYNFVTLLIGVNNQYRGLSIENFENDFKQLLQQAIEWAGNNASNVIVISIPDWGVTPFAQDRDIAKIATEIDAFNIVCERLAQQFNAQYIEITNGTRIAKNDTSLLTTDGLHYSFVEYRNWAKQIFESIKKNIN